MKRVLRTLTITIICFLIHFKNGENKTVHYRDILKYGNNVGFYNSDRDKLIISPDSFWYYERVSCCSNIY